MEIFYKNIHIFKILILTLSTGLLSPLAFSQNTPSKTHQIIAGFILKFTSFVEWPDNTAPYLNICIVGKDPFKGYIDKMIIRKPTNRSGKKLIIYRIKTGNSVNKCNLIFITKKSSTPEFWKSIPEKHSILLVSEFDGFTKSGGIINLHIENKKIQLEININNSRLANLKISSQLLKLAKITNKTKEIDNE